MAARIAIFWPLARVDIFEAAEFIAKQNQAVAVRFLAAAERTCNELAQSPELGFLAEFDSAHLADVRRWKIKGFGNYLIFYRESSAGVEIIRIVHGARNIDAIFGSEDD